MSPSVEYFEKQIGRELKKGDVLINQSRSFEVVKPHLPAGEAYDNKDYYFSVPTIRVRELSSQGPVNATEDVPRNFEPAWTGIVKKEDRTDVPWWKKIF